LCNRWVFSARRKVEGVIGGESEDRDCDEVICTIDEVNQDDNKQEKIDGTREGAASTGKMMHI